MTRLKEARIILYFVFFFLLLFDFSFWVHTSALQSAVQRGAQLNFGLSSCLLYSFLFNPSKCKKKKEKKSATPTWTAACSLDGISGKSQVQWQYVFWQVNRLCLLGKAPGQRFCNLWTLSVLDCVCSAMLARWQI